MNFVAPHLDLLARPAAPAQPTAVPPPPAVRERLAELRADYAEQVAHADGRYTDVAGAEWRALPVVWRAALTMIAGVGDDLDLFAAAERGWQTIPENEQALLRQAVRDGKRCMARLAALAARL